MCIQKALRRFSLRFLLAVSMTAPGAFLSVTALTGCATETVSRQSAPPDDLDANSRRSPASYFIDRFQVPKDLPDHSNENRNIPFFFKKCNVAGASWRGRNYECDVGF